MNGSDNMEDKFKCISCEEMCEADELGGYTEDGPFCYDCQNSDRDYAPTVKIYNNDGQCYDGHEDSDGAVVCCVGDLCNETNGEFQNNYVHTDGWRGYHELKSDVWEIVHEDTILSGSRDSVELETFYDQFRELLDIKGIPYAVAFCPTSNVFSVNMEFFTKADYASEVADIVENLKELYRDPARFVTTALTGADPEDQSPEDQLFALFASQML